MNQLPLKYNPGFNDDEELIRQFVVRHKSLDLILRTIAENTGPSNQHILVVGPRGSGKTMLVRRVASELRTNPGFAAWFPVVFAEESYEVSTPGEFWLEALFRLADQTKSERWCKAYKDIKQDTDDVRVGERALAQLLDFAKENGKRMLLIVENLNMLLGQQLTDEDAWGLRHTLMNEPRIMMLDTALARFSKISNSGKPWFELFAVHSLEPLDPNECSVLWRAISEKEAPVSRLRPIQILTGGNPRLIRILAEFANFNSFRDLMSDLVHLVDEHTEYFKSQLDTLAANERKTFVALLDLWDPVPARSVALHARMPVSATSAFLNRLASRGAVTIVDTPGRKKLYQSAERLYNIYYLMRKRGHPSNRVRAAVRFMMQFYRGRRLVEPVARLAREACNLAPRLRVDHYEAYKDIVDTCSEALRPQIVDATPREFFNLPDTPQSIRAYGKLKKRESAEKLVVKGYRVQREQGDWREAETLFRKAIEIDPEYGHAWAHLGQLLYLKSKKYDDAAEALGKATCQAPDDSWAWFQLGIVLEFQHKNSEAEMAFKKVTELNPTNPSGWIRYGGLLHDLGRYTESQETYQTAIREIKGEEASGGWANLGELYHYHLHRPHEAEAAYRKALQLGKSENNWVQFSLANLLTEHLGRSTEAEEYFHRAEAGFRERIDRDPADAQAWRFFGAILARDKARRRQAVDALRKALELDPANTRSRRILFDLLFESGDFEAAERVCRDEIQIEPSHQAWAQVGLVMESSGRYSEAEKSYSKALEFDESVEWTWVHLGRCQFRNSKQNHEARISLEKAVSIGGGKSQAWPYLLELRLVEGESIVSIIEQANRFIGEQTEGAGYFNTLAWAFNRSGRDDVLPEAERLARKAVETMKPENWAAVHTLATVLGREGKWHEAISTAAPLFDGAAESETAIRDSIDFAVSAGSAGYASDVLRILGESKGKAALEPLEVGLRKFLNEKPLTAQEISEVANDVAARIRAKQAEARATSRSAKQEET